MGNPKKKRKKVRRKFLFAQIEMKERMINRLKDELQQKEDYISHLERLSEAYTALEELSHKELLEADRMIQAQDIIQNMMQQERLVAEETIKAQEIVQELSIKEKQDADQTIKAFEQFEALSEKERLDADKTIQAQQSILDLASKEKEDAEKTIMAHQNLQTLTSKEMEDAEKLIKAQQELSNLSMSELMQRDKAIRNVLDINKTISSILDEELLFDRILRSLADSLKAKRGVLFLKAENGIQQKSLYGIKADDIQKKTFSYSSNIIDESARSQNSRLIINQKIKTGKTESNISIIAVPLIYEKKFLGVIYLDNLSETETFKHLDLEVAEIFSSQAAISINNTMLYLRIREQNEELMRLMNLKNQFYSHVSENLAIPISAVQNQMQKLIANTEISEADRSTQLNRILTQVNKLENTVKKIISIEALENEVDQLFSDKVNFLKIIQDILEKHHEEKDKRKIKVTTLIPSEFEEYKGNETIIRTILDELISNSIFYNRENGNVDIRGTVHDDFLALDVIDTGWGIKDEDKEHVFEQFYRTEDSPTLNEYGAGLGLYMVKTFVSHYRGEVKMRSQYKRGSTFSVSFLRT